MSDKASQSTERLSCIVCCAEYESEVLIMDADMREMLEKLGIAKWGLCPTCRALRDEGFIALVECDPEKSGNPKAGQRVLPDKVHRTGVMVRIPQEVFYSLFGRPAFARMPCVYVPPGVIQQLRDRMLH